MVKFLIPLFPLFLLSTLGHLSNGQRRSSSPPISCSDWRSRIDKDGTVIFIAGDRSLIIPRSLPEADNFCSKILDSVNSIRLVSRACLKPYPKQIIGLIVYGTRNQVKKICSNDAEKNQVIRYSSCLFNKTAYNKIHDTMDDFIKLIEYIRDEVPDPNKHLSYVCCYYQDFKEVVRSKFRNLCTSEAIEYTINYVDKSLEDSLDLVCGNGLRDLKGAKCTKILKEAPLSVPKSKIKQSLSVLLPLVDIYTNLGAAPESMH